MNRKLFTKKSTRLLGLTAFIVTGGGLIISTAFNEENFYKTEVLIIIGCFFAISLADHFKKLTERDDENKINKKRLCILLCSFIGVTLTWFINHKIGYRAVIANGLVGEWLPYFLQTTWLV